MTKSAKLRDPLEPLTTVTGALLGIICLGFIALIPATIFGSGSMLGFGRSAYICADTGGLVNSPSTQSLLQQTQSGVSLSTTGFHLCATHPSTNQRLWYTLLELPTTVLFVGGVLMAFLLVRNAARHGIYTPATAGRLRALAWFLIGGAILQSLIQHLAASKLLATMITSASGPLTDSTPYHLQWSVLLTGAGVLSFARIMRIGATMQEDLEGTV